LGIAQQKKLIFDVRTNQENRSFHRHDDHANAYGAARNNDAAAADQQNVDDLRGDQSKC